MNNTNSSDTAQAILMSIMLSVKAVEGANVNVGPEVRSDRARWVRECRSVEYRIGRQMGHTSAAIFAALELSANKGVLFLCPTRGMERGIHRLAPDRKFDTAITPRDERDAASMQHKHRDVDYVIIDNASTVSYRTLDRIFENILGDPLYILIG